MTRPRDAHHLGAARRARRRHALAEAEAGPRLREARVPRGRARRRCAATRWPPTALPGPGHARAGGWLHYRIIDVSSIKELARRWYPRAYFASPEKHGGHRALADIKESIEELKYYREALFVPPAGPDPRPPGRSPPGTPQAGTRRPTAGAGEQPVGSITGDPVPVAAADSATRAMVGVAQLVEHRVVVLDAAGSSPVTHPSVSAGQRPCPETG